MSESIATQEHVGRPKKWNEDTKGLSMKVPESLWNHLEAKRASSAHAAAFAVLAFEKRLTELLADVHSDLLQNATDHRQEYSLDRAELLARLIKQGLSCEKVGAPCVAEASATKKTSKR